MKKFKRSTLLPLTLLIYLAIIAVYACPGRSAAMNVSWLQYGVTIGITLGCIIFLRLVLLKRDKMRQKKH